VPAGWLHLRFDLRRDDAQVGAEALQLIGVAG
jgi:hypothetical protein